MLPVCRHGAPSDLARTMDWMWWCLEGKRLVLENDKQEHLQETRQSSMAHVPADSGAVRK